MASTKGSGSTGSDGPEAAREVRPEAAQTEPRRDGWAGGSPAAAPEDQDRSEAAHEVDVGHVVADAVRIGYEVIGDNLRQGRAAADKFSAGVYYLDDVPKDLKLLGRRLVKVSQEMGTLWFDLAAAVLRDPGLRDALAPQPVAKAKYGHKGHGASGGGAGLAAQGHVTLTCAFDSPLPCRANPVTVPALKAPQHLVMESLEADAGRAPPITGVRILSGGSADMATVLITVPAKQPAGVYVGVVRESAGGVKLATLRVEVGA